MANGFGTDFIIQAEDPQAAAHFYVEKLGFKFTDDTPSMVSLHGKNINFFIERGPAHGPVFEVFVGDVEAAKERLVKAGCTIVKDEPHVPRCYVRDPNGVTYNLAP